MGCRITVGELCKEAPMTPPPQDAGIPPGHGCPVAASHKSRHCPHRPTYCRDSGGCSSDQHIMHPWQNGAGPAWAHTKVDHTILTVSLEDHPTPPFGCRSRQRRVGLYPPRASRIASRKVCTPKGLSRNRSFPSRTSGKSWLLGSPLMRMNGSPGSCPPQRCAKA